MEMKITIMTIMMMMGFHIQTIIMTMMDNEIMIMEMVETIMTMMMTTMTIMTMMETMTIMTMETMMIMTMETMIIMITCVMMFKNMTWNSNSITNTIVKKQDSCGYTDIKVQQELVKLYTLTAMMMNQ